MTPTALESTVPWWLVASLRNRFGLNNFVETGTAGGHTAVAASKLFSHVYTIELDKQRPPHTAAKSCLNVSQFHGSSPTVLLQVLEWLEGPTLFFLDAHWCGGPKLGPECPLLDELRVIRQRESAAHDVVMIDDARLFLAKPPAPHNPAEWPDISEVLPLLQPRKVLILCDVIIATPEPIMESFL